MLKKVKISERFHKNYDVITLGSGTRDVFVNTESKIMHEKMKDKRSRDMIAYPLGSKLLIEGLKFEVGGGGTNTAVSLSRLGLKTGWIGSIGSCENSMSIVQFMHDERIDFLGRKGKGMSGYSIILDSEGNDRTILAFKGENNKLSFNQLNTSEIAKTRWMYFSSMVGKSFQTQKRVANFAGKKGIKIAFNPSSYQAKLGIKALKTILKNTNILALNLEEAESLTGESELKDMIRKIHLSGPAIALVTDGAKGAYCSDGVNMYKAHPQNIKIKETTGAGDAFSSTFLGAFIRTEDIKTSLKLAVTNAQSVIQSHGAKNVLLKWDDLIRKEKRKPVKVTET